MCTQYKQTDEQRRYTREYAAHWRARNPERARALQLRYYKRTLEQAGFTVSGGVDLDGADLKGGAGE